jgi:hypothetical protein
LLMMQQSKEAVDVMMPGIVRGGDGDGHLGEERISFYHQFDDL